MLDLGPFATVIIIIMILILSGLKIMREYERAVIFRRWGEWSPRGGLGRAPLPEEIGAEMRLPVPDVLEIMRTGAEPISLETPIGDEGESSLLDFVGDKFHPTPAEEAMESDICAGVRKALAVLAPRQEMVLRYRFGIGESRDYTLEELGERFSLTRERIRQIEQKAIRRLRFPVQRPKAADESEFQA